MTYLTPQKDGLIDLALLADALRDDTILVSIMHVNNEIGVIQDIKSIGSLLQGKGIIFHVDAAQSAGKIAINLRDLSVDLMSFSAHKIYGPKELAHCISVKNLVFVYNPKTMGEDMKVDYEQEPYPLIKLWEWGRPFY